MGIGASSSSQVGDSAGNSINGRGAIMKAKTISVGNFSKQCTSREKYNRAELEEFLRIQRKERKEMDSDLDKEETSVDRFRIRPKTAGLRRSTKKAKEDVWRKVKVKVESDAACFRCGKVINFIINGYPCRVCTRIFHKECLENCEGCRPGDLDMMERAHCIIGWSCYRCGDLTTLLTDEELKNMMEEFDKHDKNRDAVISKDEYIRYKLEKCGEGENGITLDTDFRRHHFLYEVMDSDGNGLLDWWEFVNQECTRLLAKRKTEHLAQLLTEKETLRLKEEFDAMDDNDDGVITEFEAKKAYRTWFSSYGGKSRSSVLFGDSEELRAHVEDASRFFTKADADNSGTVTWEEFRNNQALYVLSNRPNLRFPKDGWGL